MRERAIYGDQSFKSYFSQLKSEFPKLNLAFEQHNSEGGLIDAIHEYGLAKWSIIINPGAYTHTSIGIRDALQAVQVQCIEVHISDIHAREPFRHHSYFTAKCIGFYSGMGLKGYEVALQHLLDKN